MDDQNNVPVLSLLEKVDNGNHANCTVATTNDHYQLMNQKISQPTQLNHHDHYSKVIFANQSKKATNTTLSQRNTNRCSTAENYKMTMKPSLTTLVSSSIVDFVVEKKPATIIMSLMDDDNIWKQEEEIAPLHNNQEVSYIHRNIQKLAKSSKVSSAYIANINSSKEKKYDHNLTIMYSSLSNIVTTKTKILLALLLRLRPPTVAITIILKPASIIAIIVVVVTLATRR